ncbi:hypothetical protein T265_05219 [Opisthorchis viverrini]|uniref:IBR domain-containing protein n=1 Tax=Opisthorchis viverrini TaxID=6198 RepID=A0A074ZKD9_OPIVI|nr:hypothetical protein T265_05219 [Opisthorchis viverrini]KER27793.1 hypothetical protein T265_05219 [Opisthorchis viverrini]
MEHDGFGSRLTSTPYEKTFRDASGRSTFRPSNLYESFDTGYHTGAPSCSTQSFLEFGIADDVSMLPKRPSHYSVGGRHPATVNYYIKSNVASFFDWIDVIHAEHSLCPPHFAYTTDAPLPTSLLVQTPEELHICPVCSGPAYHRASEWPNRLHCQSVTCGLSVCFVCHREHSPSETCPIREPRPVLRMPSPESEPVRGRLKRKLNKLALRRL